MPILTTPEARRHVENTVELITKAHDRDDLRRIVKAALKRAYARGSDDLSEILIKHYHTIFVKGEMPEL